MKFLDEELVSIITPLYNSEKYISDTINSVLKQTYINWEMIIIDDFSSDNSFNIVKEYSDKDSRIKLIRLNKNSGVAIARNKGIREARGKYLTFIDSDDLWENNFIEKSINFMLNNNYSFIYSSYRRSDENLEKLFKDYIVPLKVNYNDLLKSNRISCLTAFININTLGKMYMNETLYSHEDYSLWLNILKKIDFAYGIQDVLATYRIRKTSLSRNKIKMAKAQWKFLREIEKLNFFKAIYYFILYSYNGIRKYK
ncbi:glycosyltransferase family 2 protein [Aliarcobacter butzleri]|uniref:glycosyltransferase family 2 protein n=1 Tax=Aliarcobacter butzleri TaxID=28197 RepID=UPI00287471FF|nr:glycosyltransferase family 2 protein [Aliarcobacter butzleri]MDS1369877.1 glycosyltransferase family 2 protein [Aliarcobacter butzleri]